MRWYCFEDKLYAGDWRVEGKDNEERVYTAIFSGPDAHERAEEYADWKTLIEQQRRPIRKAS